MRFFFFQIFRPFKQDDLDRLFERYKNSSSHVVRHRSHILLLFASRFSYKDIREVLFLKEKRYACKVARFWFYNGFEVLSATDLNNYKTEIEKPRPLNYLKNQRRVEINFDFIFLQKLVFILGLIVKIITQTYQKILNVIYKFYNQIIAFLSELASRISSVKFVSHYKKYLNQTKQTAKVYVKKGGQIRNLVQIQIDTTGVKTKIEDIYATTLGNLRKEILNILDKVDVERLSSSDAILALALAFSDKIQQMRDVEKRKRYLAILATFMAVYIWYHTTIKAGFLIFTIAGITIFTLNFNSLIYSNQYQSEKEIENMLERDSTDTNDPVNNLTDSMFVNNKDEIDTVRGVPFVEEKIELEFVPKDDCYFLSEIGRKQLKYIEQNHVDIFNESYYIDTYDERYYVHIAAYNNLEYARFQRLYLVSRGYNRTKIIAYRGKFYLSIFDYNLDGLWLSCQAKDDWNALCEIEKSKARIIYNGI